VTVGSAAGIASAVVAGRVRAVDVLDDHLSRHASLHGRLNALVQQRFRAAADDAAAVDAAPTGLLAGVPVSIKECFPVRGMLTSLGIESRRSCVDAADAPLVSRLRAAGAIVIGKGNVPQAMYLHETDNPVWGRSVHPEAAERGPGGSSGGDAALVAAGVVPLAVGNDLAGSLRQPAHACGIATIMPRSAVLGDGGAFDTMPLLRVVRPRAGFLGRTIDDLELALVAVGATEPGACELPLRVAWWDDAGPVPASAAIVRGVHEAVGWLRDAGAEASARDGALACEAAWLHLAILSADGGSQVRSLFGRTRPIRAVRRLLQIGGLSRPLRGPLAALVGLLGSRLEARALGSTGPRGAAGMAALEAARDAIAMRFAAEYAGCDAIVCPVSALPALRHGSADQLLLAAAPCLLANLLDLPAGAVPVTRVRGDEERCRPPARDPVLRAAARADEGSAGLPVAVQVIAGPGRDEATVLRVMRVIAQEAGGRSEGTDHGARLRR
jgi:fatty acid amide hydrolase